MKKRLALALSIVMSVGLLGGCGSSASTTGAKKEASVTSSAAETSAVAGGNNGEKKELKWGSVGTQTTLREQAMAKAIEEINAKAEGIHITGYYDSTLGGSQDLVEGIQEGMVDFITEGPAQFGSWIPKAAQVEAPFLWQSVEHMTTTMNGEYLEEMDKLFTEKVGVHILGTLYYGTRQLTTKKPVKTLDDLKGMKVRVPETDLYVKMVQSWGAAATPMNINELYMALQTGTVDGQENPLPTFEAQKFYEVVKNITLTNHIICPSMMFVNLDTWNSLSKKDQEVVQAAVKNAIEWENQAVLDAEKELQDKMTKEYGCTVITPDDSIREATIPAIKPLIEDWDKIQSYAK